MARTAACFPFSTTAALVERVRETLATRKAPPNGPRRASIRPRALRFPHRLPAAMAAVPRGAVIACQWCLVRMDSALTEATNSNVVAAQAIRDDCGSGAACGKRGARTDVEPGHGHGRHQTRAAWRLQSGHGRADPRGDLYRLRSFCRDRYCRRRLLGAGARGRRRQACLAVRACSACSCPSSPAGSARWHRRSAGGRRRPSGFLLLLMLLSTERLRALPPRCGLEPLP